MNVLSIQSHVVYGHVGNSAATFPMQRLGLEVWPVHTVQFANHTGYGAPRGEVFAPALIDACVTGLAERGALARCDAVLSGYIGAAETGAAVLRAVAAVKQANPRALYCCDPVMGDVGRGVFVRDGVPEFFKAQALAAADLVTPNHFELEMLAGRDARDHAALRAALAALRGQGPARALATSLVTAETPMGFLDMAACDADGLYLLRTPRLDACFHGAGDVTAALFLAHLLRGRDTRAALSLAGSSLAGLLRRTVAAGGGELALVAAQEEFVAPSAALQAEPL
jgi:pyridoxine kinase